MFDARERAVLAWTDALTQIAERGAPQALYDALKEYFSDKEITALTSAVAIINYWNRLAIASGNVTGMNAARADANMPQSAVRSC